MRLNRSVAQTGLAKRLMLGFAALATTAVIGTAGMASAHSMKPPKNTPHGNHGHHNQGHGHGQGHGYGGGNNNQVDTDVNLEVNGDNNVINIVIHYIFG